MQKFNLETATKRTPYRVPDNFFATLEENILAQTVDQAKNDACTKRSPKFLRLILTTAAAIAVAATIGTGIYRTSTAPALTTDQAFANLSAPDKEFLSDCYDNDLMLEAYLYDRD